MNSTRNAGIQVDPVFIGLTRPAMVWGVTYSGLLVNTLFTLEIFIFTQNLLWLLAFVPVHGLMVLACTYEPRFFDLAALWVRTRAYAYLSGTMRYWRANSYSPLAVDLPNAHGRRRAAPATLIH